MERKRRSGLAFLATVLALGAFVSTAIAGPPLVCHAFDIGSARSLPWGAPDGKSWNSPAAGYDLSRLANDTIGLLSDGMPVIVRMETIRRAAIYASKNAAVARELLARLKARMDAGGSRDSNGLHLFDYGYLVETIRQVPPRTEASAWAPDTDGYPQVQKALSLRENDPEMEFAASIVTLYPKRDREHKEHFRLAVSGAKADPLLARNLLSHFPDRGTNLADLEAVAAVGSHN